MFPIRVKGHKERVDQVNRYLHLMVIFRNLKGRGPWYLNSQANCKTNTYQMRETC